jgi:DNA-binding MurR/RpiR family transcriptional regulator
VSHFAKKVYGYYQNILRENCERVDEQQIRRVAEMLDNSRRVIIYGVGSSGMAAREIQFRFMRLGVDVEVITDPHMMRMSSVLVDDHYLVIGLSLSGQTPEVLDALCAAKKNKAKVVFVTANSEAHVAECCDEILHVIDMKNMDFGNKISPQFPMLVVFDILYAYYMEKDSYRKTQKHKDTVSAVRMQ